MSLCGVPLPPQGSDTHILTSCINMIYRKCGEPLPPQGSYTQIQKRDATKTGCAAYLSHRQDLTPGLWGAAAAPHFSRAAYLSHRQDLTLPAANSATGKDFLLTFSSTCHSPDLCRSLFRRLLIVQQVVGRVNILVDPMPRWAFQIEFRAVATER